MIEGELHVDGGVIAYVGAPRPALDAEIYDCGGNLIVQGLCNAHAHSAMTLFRGIADDLPLDKWLNDCIFPMEAHCGEEELYWGTKLAELEYARGGITAVADMYGDCASAFEGTGFHLTMVGHQNDLTVSTEKVLYALKDNYQKYHGKGRIDFMLGAHAEYTCSDGLLYGLSDLAADLEAPVNIHLSETLKEVGECDVRRGMSPVAFFHKIGLFDYGGLAAHCVWCDKDDLALLQDKGVTPVVNSASNLKLASGFAPIPSMLAQGLLPALGTDGAASNNALSILHEMRLYATLSKGVMKDAAVVTAEQTLDAATQNGYRALGLSGGEIKRGNPADFWIADLSAPCMQPDVSAVKSLTYSADTSVVLATVAGGRRVYDKGNYAVGERVEDIYANCRRLKKKLLSKI